MRLALLVALALAAPLPSALAQGAEPDSLAGAVLPDVLPDSLRPAPGPEPRTLPPDGAPPAPSAASRDGSAEDADAAPLVSVWPGTAGNALELAVANGSGSVALVGVRAVVARSPAWARVAEASAAVEAVAPGAEGLVRFAFDVVAEAPVGAEGWLVVEVVDASGARLATHRVGLTVAPPAELALDLPRPNPSRGRVALPFALPTAAHVTVEVLDVLGRRVAVLADGDYPAGRAEAELDAAALAPGVYVVRLVAEAGGRPAQRTRSLTVVR